MDIEKICMGCMRELKEPGVCPHCGFDSKAVRAEGHYLKPYTILNGKYLVGKVLGEGGFGITYIGYDINLEMPVAIKEFYPNGFVMRESDVTSMVSVYRGTNLEAVSKWKSNFIREARTLAKCSHLSGIVGVKDFFEENGTAYIAMEYLQGMTLKDYAKSNGGRLEAGQLLRRLEPVMSALAKVHEYGLIHRDISPDNIMLLEGGNMKLLDFGAARDYASEEEKSLSVLLKPGYAPEEQYRTHGKQGPWSDIYAFSATIYRCITGVTPPESMERMRQDDLKRPSELGIVLPPRMENALMKGMAVYAENRYQSMAELMMELLPETRNMSAMPSAQENISPAKPDITVTGVHTVEEQSGTEQQEKDALQRVKELCRQYKSVLIAAAGILAVILLIGMIKGKGGEDKSTVDVEETPVEVAQELVEEKEEDFEKKAEETAEKGKAKMEEGDLDTAQAYFEEARRLDPSNEEIYLLQSELHLQKEDYLSAVSVLNEGIGQTGNIVLDTRRSFLTDHIHLTRREGYLEGRLLEEQEYRADGKITRQTIYDENGELTEWGEYIYNGDVLSSEVHYYENGVQKWGTAYDELGRESVYAAYDRNSQMTEVAVTEYDDTGLQAWKTYYNPRGLSINSSMERVVRNGVSWWKEYNYDENGNQIQDVSYNQDGSLSSWQEYYYDMENHETGYASFFQDGTRNTHGEYTYDEKGNRISFVEYDQSENVSWGRKYEYDVLNHCVKELRYYGNFDEANEEVEYVNHYQFEEGAK